MRTLTRSAVRASAVAAALLLLLPNALRPEPTFFQTRVAPVFEQHCVGCHGSEKQKAGLRLDSFEALMKGAEGTPVVTPGDSRRSELFRRVSLPADHEDVMPADGKPLLAREEIALLATWIEKGASAARPLSDFAEVPALKTKPAPVPLAPDWRIHAAEIAALERVLGVRLAPRSQIPTDGLVLRTASAPARCDDAALEKLRPLAALIVEAELARTKITDAGARTLARWENLRSLDLTRTAVSSAGALELARSNKLESLNLTDTRVDETAVARLRSHPTLQRLWLFGTPAAAPAASPSEAAP